MLEHSQNDTGNPPEPDDLTETQLETLRAIYTHPEATQGELGELLDVSSATICQRVNAIEIFDWSSRHEFVKSVLNEEMIETGEPTAETATNSDVNRPS